VTRRRVVVLSSAFSLLAVGVLAGLLVISVLKTQFGRNFARDFVEGRVAPKVRGKLHIGKITGLSFGGATIDSVEIRGPDDSLFIAAGRITVRWDPRDVIDKRTSGSAEETGARRRAGVCGLHRRRLGRHQARHRSRLDAVASG
jgi:hypothetical protein